MCPIDTPCLSASEVVSDAGQNGRFWRLRTLKLWFFIIREKRKPFPPFLLLFPLWGIYSERNTIRSLSPSSFALSLVPPPPPSHFSHLPDDWCTKPWISPAPVRLPSSPRLRGGGSRQCHNHSFALLPLIAEPHSSGGRLYQQKAASTMLDPTSI